jgi:hypothetical protein
LVSRFSVAVEIGCTGVSEERGPMEGVEGLFKGLKLFEERRGVKIRGRRMEEMEGGEPHAIGKLFSEKQAYAEAIANALGPI